MKKNVLLIVILICIAVIYTISLLITRNAEIRKVKRYNLEYEYYLNRVIYGNDLATAIDKVTNQNEINRVPKDEKKHYIDNGENSIRIDVKFNFNGKMFPMEEFYNRDITEFVSQFNIVKFKCVSIEYHEKTGRVSRLVFEDIEEY